MGMRAIKKAKTSESSQNKLPLLGIVCKSNNKTNTLGSIYYSNWQNGCSAQTKHSHIFPSHTILLLSRPNYMLSELRIQNYALIEKVVLQTKQGFTVLTGETGAGKSIIMGALGLVLGDRADTGMLFDKQQKCVVEALFTDAVSEETLVYLAEQDFLTDDSNEILLRRELSPGGKSRAFINDIPASLQQLRQLTAMLVNLHRQFDTLELGESGFQQKVIDAFAGNLPLLKEYSSKFDLWKKADQHWKKLSSQKETILKDADYNRYLLDELEALALNTDELEQLAVEYDLLNHGEEIKISLQEATALLQHVEMPVITVLKQIAQRLDAAADHYPALHDQVKRIQSTQLELQDIASELSRMESKIDVDETRMVFIRDRLNEGYRLQKKHQVNSTAALLQIQESLAQKVRQIENMDADLDAAEKEVTQNYRLAFTMAIELEDNRKKVLEPFSQACSNLLRQVGMPHATIAIVLHDTTLMSSGKNTIQLLFDANGNQRLEPLEKVASGGELSRLMLCLKSLVAEKMDMPTLIFDEIDSGISGEAAQQTGAIMQQLAANRQVIAITHQPQIAGKANAHFLIYKETRQGITRSAIRALSKQERLETIARMVSGDNLTKAALQHASELMDGTHIN